jgi:uncharacterized membrane protein YedE/YeeE
MTAAGVTEPQALSSAAAARPAARAIAIAVAILIAAGIAIASNLLLTLPKGRDLSLSLLFGAAFGVVLQRGRFCFFCNVRDFIERRDPAGVISILTALATGVIGYALVFGAWVPVPGPERLPPTAHVGPVSLALPLAAFAFGVGMTLSGSCLSAHLYRIGEGSLVSPIALAGALGGFALGFATWNTIYLSLVSEGAVVWLPGTLGYAGGTLLSLAFLVVLAEIVLARAIPVTRPSEPPSLTSIFTSRWPPVLTGVLVGVVATLAYFRIAPLGVTAELGSIARTGAAAVGALPETLYGLDTFRGCATAVRTLFLSENGVFVMGLMAASFASALASSKFKPRVPSRGQALRGLVGGVLMGWGAMTALGCTVGVLLSGIHAQAASGWVFLAFCFAGVASSLAVFRNLSR